MDRICCNDGGLAAVAHVNGQRSPLTPRAPRRAGEGCKMSPFTHSQAAQDSHRPGREVDSEERAELTVGRPGPDLGT